MAKVKGTKITFEKNEDIKPICEYCLEPLDPWGKCDCIEEDDSFDELDFLEDWARHEY